EDTDDTDDIDEGRAGRDERRACLHGSQRPTQLMQPAADRRTGRASRPARAFRACGRWRRPATGPSPELLPPFLSMRARLVLATATPGGAVVGWGALGAPRSAGRVAARREPRFVLLTSSPLSERSEGR